MGRIVGIAAHGSASLMNYQQTLARFGADPASLRLFEGDAPELLPYATLLSARADGNPDLAAVDGVYEWQDAPLIYLVDADQLRGDPDRLSRIRRLLAMRGDTPYVGVVSPGRLTIYRIALDKRRPEQVRVALGFSEGQEFATFAYLGNNRPGITRAPWISEVVLKLLSGSIDGLKNECGISGDDAISLVGRALFARFLADREMLPRVHRDGADPSEWFDDAAHAKKTSAWLDQTFNGDFLPLAARTFEKLPKRGYKLLGDVLRRHRSVASVAAGSASGVGCGRCNGCHCDQMTNATRSSRSAVLCYYLKVKKESRATGRMYS
jgi:hypothetical protein